MIQDVLIFMLESPLNRTWRVQEICRCVLLPILLEQYKIIQDGGSWYDVKNKVKLKHKQTKPKVENICEWK